MRVVNSSTYRNFTNSVNDVHSKLNKSMNKVSSGKAYESAAENPLAYYQGQKIDSQYQEALTKQTLISDLSARVDQQCTVAYSIQTTLSQAKTKLQYIRSDTSSSDTAQVTTIRNDLFQKEQSMINDLNSQYQNFYIFGGNDLSTKPFTLSDDGQTLTYSHKFPGSDQTVEMTMTLQDDGTFKFGDATTSEDDTLKNILNAMKEQGRVDIGYGTIADKDTLLNTYTSGLNLLTGLTSEALNACKDDNEAIVLIKERLNTSPIAILGNAVAASDNFIKNFDDESARSTFSTTIGNLIDTATETESTISTVYSDYGNKYSLLEDLDEKLGKTMDSLTEQYTNLLGADAYEAITEMYSYQYSYSAALQMGAQMMQSSLFNYLT